MPDSSPPPSPQQIGSYRILDLLGEGGMGEVYVAEQSEPVKRRVALKVIKLGMDSREIVARFQQERQALALMAHDGIAKVYDVGTTERGQPYFVMELVKGVPLHEYCDKHKLGLKERIGLMQQVCAAVTHAHQKGVVHRDLKPGNVLVADNSGGPQAKVIDFGLAKAMGQKLVEATLFTAPGRIVGTPEYMAPEQADPTNADIDTRVDVYSLGVMLYETLVGSLPFARERLRLAGLEGLQRLLRDEEPQRPSQRLSTLGPASTSVCQARRISPAALHKALRTDLDWVALKAMEKDRNRRYESPAALSADLQRYLDHEPLQAGPPSAWYRLQKLVRRYRGQFVAAGLVSLTLVAGGVTTLVQWRRAERNAEDNGRTVSNFHQLSAVIRLQDALDHQDRLWPARPDKVAALQAWLHADCAQLLAQRPQIEATIAELRRKAVPLTAEQVEADRRASPEWASYERQQQLTASLRRAQAIRSGSARLELPDLPTELTSANADVLKSFARRRVNPTKPDGDMPERTTFGEEAAALAAARTAVAKSAASPESFQFLDTLALAALANGQDEEAMQCAAEALAKAPTQEREAYLRRRSDIESAIVEAPARLAAAEAVLAAFDARVSMRRTWTFGGDEVSRSAEFLHNALVDVLAGLNSMATKERADVEQRLLWARQVRAASLAHPKAGATWAAAREAIARADDVEASKRYRGLSIPLEDEAVIGLVPIGMNPATKLWEFYDLRSAWDGKQSAAEIAIPTHKKDGAIEVEANTGIVFVLLPGGTVTLGSQKDDPTQPNYDPEHEDDETLHTVTLSPFLLARHELTRGQWQRLAGVQLTSWTEGVFYHGDRIAVGRTHPADSMDWETADKWLTRHGMVLPTEAQWEYGARGGTTTVFWPGASATDLQDCANLHDMTSFARYPQRGAPAPITDGFRAIAPVASFKPNSFGLHDVHGNVWEWCLDACAINEGERAGDGPRPPAASSLRADRGGSFSIASAYSRTANRGYNTASFRSASLGLRPARSLKF